MKKIDIKAIYDAKNRIRSLNMEVWRAARAGEIEKASRIQGEIRGIRETIQTRYSIIL